MFHHQLWEGALGLEHHSKHGLTQALQDLLESGDIFSNPLSIKKGHDSSPFRSMANDKVSQGHFSLSFKLLDLAASFMDLWAGSGPVPGPR